MFLFKKKKLNKVVLFIHGLENKPPKKLLKKWYLKSIHEGFNKHELEVCHFDFEVVYWADLLYTKPLDPVIKDENHPLYLDEPYHESVSASSMREPNNFKRKLFDRLENFIDGFFLSKKGFVNVEYLFDMVASRVFKDLHVYYRKKVKVGKKSEEAAKKIIRQRLHNVLKAHSRKKIFLIAHSMGSIVAFDVLSFLASEISIHTKVTIGSPLGLPMIKREIFKEYEQEFTTETRLPTPQNIRHHWINIADLDDNVAINYNLKDDYAPNNSGVAPIDHIVINDYQFNGNKNPHKSFGYLRSKPLVEALNGFLQEKEPNLLERFKYYCKNLIKGKR